MRILVLAFSLVFATAAAPASSLPTFAEATPYAQVRAALTRQGWRPQPPPHPARDRCVDYEQFCSRYPELYQCWDVLLAPCNFAWRRPDGALVYVVANTGGAAEPEFREFHLPGRQERQAFFAPPRADLPYFPKHTPYAEVRPQLVRDGFLPVRVLRREPGTLVCKSDAGFCRRYPEVIQCLSTGAAFCEFLYRRKLDGELFLVRTEFDAPPGWLEIAPAEREYLKTIRFEPVRAKPRP